MQVDEVQRECDRLMSIMRSRRTKYTISSWCLVGFEFVANCATVVASASIIWTNETVVSYLTLVCALLGLLASAVHRYINPESKAMEYNAQLQSCAQVKCELHKLTGKSTRAAEYYAYLQELDTGLFALTLPNSIASESPSPTTPPRPTFDLQQIDLPHTPEKRKRPSILPIDACKASEDFV